MTHTILYIFDLVSNEIYSITHKWGTHLKLPKTQINKTLLFNVQVNHLTYISD